MTEPDRTAPEAPARLKELTRQSFDRIAGLPDLWDHNRQYQPFLLERVPDRCGQALDIGCGTGEFTALLARKAASVTGVDLAPAMIGQARERNARGNITYQTADIEHLELPAESFDCIVSIAAFHHLELETLLPRLENALAPGGVLLVLDLYQRKSMTDLLFAAAAVPAALALQFLKNRRFRVSAEERRIWDEHMKLDRYLPFAELRKLYRTHLPGALVRRRLLFRYSVVYRKG